MREDGGAPDDPMAKWLDRTSELAVECEGWARAFTFDGPEDFEAFLVARRTRRTSIDAE